MMTSRLLTLIVAGCGFLCAWGDGAVGVWDSAGMTPGRPAKVTMAPAKWIWMPCERTLSNTFVLFRKELNLSEAPVRASGWVTADSRYRLTVNGKRVQWGPAPCDPRQWDVDPCEFAALLKPGKNVVCAEVLYYGLGDGTWPAGKPGFIFNARLEFEGGRVENVVSDASWQVLPDRAHPAGMHKRWYLRALQEVFDARLRPRGWNTPEFSPDGAWLNAAVIDCPGRTNRPRADRNTPPT